MRPEHWFYTLPLRLRSLFRRRRADQDLDEEMQYHLEMQIKENIQRGMIPREARYAALRKFGGVDWVKEECRDKRRVKFIDDLVRDVLFGFRALRKASGFSVAAVLTLALGIGSTTTIFSIARSPRRHTLTADSVYAYRKPSTVSRRWHLGNASGVLGIASLRCSEGAGNPGA